MLPRLSASSATACESTSTALVMRRTAMSDISSIGPRLISKIAEISVLGPLNVHWGARPGPSSSRAAITYGGWVEPKHRRRCTDQRGPLVHMRRSSEMRLLRRPSVASCPLAGRGRNWGVFPSLRCAGNGPALNSINEDRGAEPGPLAAALREGHQIALGATWADCLEFA